MSAKSACTLEYLGCPISELRAHLEAQFTDGMSWQNGPHKGPTSWQIDHVVPIKYPGANGGPPTIEEVARRLHWTNCQPMWEVENIAKGNHFIGRARPTQAPAKPEPPGLNDAEMTEILAVFS